MVKWKRNKNTLQLANITNFCKLAGHMITLETHSFEKLPWRGIIQVIIIILFFGLAEFHFTKFIHKTDPERSQRHLSDSIRRIAFCGDSGNLSYILAEWIRGGKTQAGFFIPEQFS